MYDFLNVLFLPQKGVFRVSPSIKLSSIFCKSTIVTGLLQLGPNAGLRSCYYLGIQATTALAETTAIADFRSLTVFSAIYVVYCIFFSSISLNTELHKLKEKLRHCNDNTCYISQGSTGAPKGVAHSTAGYLVYAGFTQKHVFGYYDNNDVFGCVADIGWITGGYNLLESKSKCCFLYQFCFFKSKVIPMWCMGPW